MANLGEQIDTEITALGADYVNHRIVMLEPRLATVEFYINDVVTGGVSVQTVKYAIKMDGTALKRNV